MVHKQYVKKFGRLGDAVVNSNMEVMTQGFEQVREIRIGEMEAPDRSTLRGEAAAAGRSPTRRRQLRLGCRSHAIPEGQHERTPVTRSPRSTPSSAPTTATTSRPRRYASVGVMAAGTRRHRLEVRRAPRNSALHSRKLHAVHGVHRGLPGHGAAELLAGSGHRAAHRHRELRYRPGERVKMLHSLPEIDKRTRAMMADARGARNADPASSNSSAKYDRSGRILGGGQAAVLRHHRKSSHGLPEGQRHLLDAGTKEAGERRHLLHLRFGPVQGMRRVRHRLRRSQALKMVQETEEVNAEHESGTAFLNLLPDTPQKYLGLYNDAHPEDSKTAALRNMLMVRRNYDALVSGDGACAGCGEKSVLRAITRSPKPTCGRSITPRPTACAPRPANWKSRACRNSPN